MKNRKFFFSVLIGTAVFVYLIFSFLIASFNINLWEDSHRFFAVVIYLFFTISILSPSKEPTKVDSELMENVTAKREEK